MTPYWRDRGERPMIQDALRGFRWIAPAECLAMPLIPFESLSDDARVWVFGADRPLSAAEEERVLVELDEFLRGWQAHGTPLACARAWRDDRFLLVGVDGDG